MADINKRVYFSHEEIKDALVQYGKAIRNKNEFYSKKIPYESYRKLYGCHKGVFVVEDEKKSLWFFDASIECRPETIYAKNHYGREIAQFNKTDNSLIMISEAENDFNLFFWKKYLCNHSDYSSSPREKEDNMTYDTWINYDGNTNSSTTLNTNRCWGSDFTSSNDYTMSWNTTTTCLSEQIEEIKEEIKKLKDKNEKENEKMKGFNFDFGPCINDHVRVSMYGIAVKNQAGEWVSYNPSTGEIINVEVFNFDGRKYMFKMPVAVKDVVKGDVIIHQKKPMFVLDTDENGFVVVDVIAGEEKKIVPTTSPFGFNFTTKVVSMFSAFAAAPTPDAPFGNFLPFMMMSEDNKDIDPMTMMFIMNGGNVGDMFSNPMMLYFLTKDNDKDSMLPLMLMMNQTQVAKGKNGK